MVEEGLNNKSEWTCEGALKSVFLKVDGNGFPIRYQGEMHVCALLSGRLIRQFGWYRRNCL